MILGVKTFKGILFVEILLQKYQLLKELFLFEIEDGRATFIPKDLSQDHLPMSFRYYDPIIAIVSENISN